MSDNMDDRHENVLASAIIVAGQQIMDGLLAVAAALTLRADSLQGILIPKGAIKMFAKTEAPLTVPVGTTGKTTVVETAKGVQVPIIGPIAFASDNPAVATYAADGTWAAVGIGTCNMSQLDTAPAGTSGSGLSDSTQLTVTAAPPPVADTLIGTLVPN